ncbi:MAG TPA: hypothetical protein VFZ35_02170, partial [Sphingomicrobium sp.]
SGPALAKALVVRSAGPSSKAYPPGKALPDSARISLQPGDSVTILAPGSKRTLRGPGTFPADAGNANALADSTSKRTRFGAMRTGDLALNPSPWNLDVTQSGTMCIDSSGGLKMWRPNSEEADTLSISAAEGPATKVTWPAGKSTVDWPTALKIAEGTEYRLALSDGTSAGSVKFAVMAAIPEDVADAAQSLIQRGCQNQLDVLVDGIDGGE